MTDQRDAMTEAELRRRFGAANPGSASLGLRTAVAAVPSNVDRQPGIGWARFALPAAGLAAAAVLAVLVSQGLGLLPAGLGAGATPGPTEVFDPTLVGPGLAAPADTSLHIAAVIVLSIVLVVWAIGSTGWRRIAWLIAAAAPVAWALFGTFVPLDIGITGWGPGISIVEAVMPPGAEESLYYETAKPYEPFSFAVLLIGGDTVPVRVDSVVTYVPVDQPFGAVRWTAVWLDAAPNGGMTGPGRPFAGFELSHGVQGIWIVGHAGGCALGHAPTSQGGTSSTWPGDLQLNVSVLGWPRVVDVQAAQPLRLVEPGFPGSCAPDPRPASSPSP